MSATALVSPSQMAMAAALQAKAEAQAAGNFIAKMPAAAVSSPAKVAQLLRLGAVWDAIRTAAAGAGAWALRAFQPVAGFISKVGVLPSAALALTSETGQRIIRFTVKTVARGIAWVFGKLASWFDTAVRWIGGTWGNAFMDKATEVAAGAIVAIAKPAILAYNFMAPLVSAKSGHVRLVNKVSRVMVFFAVAGMILPGFWLPAIATFLFCPLGGTQVDAFELGEKVANDLEQRYIAAEAAARVDAHITADAASKAKMTVTETLAKVEKDVEEFVAGDPAEKAAEALASVEVPVVQEVTVPETTTPDEMVAHAQTVADSSGETITAHLPNGTTVTVVPAVTPREAEATVDAEGPTVIEHDAADEAPEVEGNRALRRAARRGGYPAAKTRASSKK